MQLARVYFLSAQSRTKRAERGGALRTQRREGNFYENVPVVITGMISKLISKISFANRVDEKERVHLQSHFVQALDAMLGHWLRALISAFPASDAE